MNGLAFLHLHHHRNRCRRRRRRRHYHHHHCYFNYVYIPLSQVWNPCISDVRSIRDKNTVPRVIPLNMRPTQPNNPTITLVKKKKYDIMENNRLKEKKNDIVKKFTFRLDLKNKNKCYSLSLYLSIFIISFHIFLSEKEKTSTQARRFGTKCSKRVYDMRPQSFLGSFRGTP